MWRLATDKPPIRCGAPLPHSTRRFVGTGWEFSLVLGRVAALLVLLLVTMLWLAGAFGLTERFEAILPEFFRKPQAAPPPGNVPGPSLPKQIGEAFGRATTLPARPPRPAHFTVGSTKEEVLAIQGLPDSVSEEAWSYGDSRVYFSRNRVVRWRSSADRPLEAN